MKVPSFVSFFLCTFLVWKIGNTKTGVVINNETIRPTTSRADRHTENISEYETKATPVKNIYFMKIHKTGTTTLFSILSRYAMKHNLRVTIFNQIPEDGNPKVLVKFLYPPFTKGKSTKYNMILDHSKYSPRSIKKILMKPTTHLTLLRNPLSLANSFLHKKPQIAHHFKLDKTNLITSYIEKLENKSISKGFYQHYMSDIFRIHSEGLGKDKTFRKLEKVFLVMISEYYDESMILMRRRLGWSFQDVLYTKLNVQNYEHKPVDEELYQRFCKSAWADCELYEYFNRTFWNNFNFYGDSITKEVRYYKKVQHDIAKFCSPVVQDIKENSPMEVAKVLKFAGSEWHEPFIYTIKDCALSIVDPKTVRAYFFYKQNPHRACKYIEGKPCRIIYDRYGICDKVCQISKEHSDVIGEILNITKSNYQSVFFKLD